MKQSFFDTETKTGIASGTLLSIFMTIHMADVLETAVLAAVGAVSSLAVTMAVKYLLKKLKD
jgi:hypothetical protein